MNIIYSPLAKIASMLISGNISSMGKLIIPPELQAADFNEEKERKCQATRLLYYAHGGNTIVFQASAHDTIIIILLY